MEGTDRFSDLKRHNHVTAGSDEYKAKLNLHCNINTEGLKTRAEKSVTIDYYLSSH